MVGGLDKSKVNVVMLGMTKTEGNGFTNHQRLFIQMSCIGKEDT